jgi:mannose-6-phosphate isomerase-like protein (cupin superfamily)
MSNRHSHSATGSTSGWGDLTVQMRAPGATLRGAATTSEQLSNPTRKIIEAERPWGDFQQLVSNEQVTVKIITVQPGHRLSLQRHDHRGEMWQVLDVPIDVTLGGRQWGALPGETIWVPQGSVHRMGNSTAVPGRVLEVAFGPFDEDDIHRLDDDYAR